MVSVISCLKYSLNNTFTDNNKCNNFLPREGRKIGGGRDELTGVNWVPVDPATLQATKIACGAHMCGLVRCNYFRV